MIVNSHDILEFTTNINIPEGFYYNRNHQLSVAVSNNYLNIYVDKIQNIPEKISSIYTREIRLTGSLLYKVSLNALISSYNYCCEAVTCCCEPIIDNGQSSEDQFIKVESIYNGIQRDYIVLGYLAEGEKVPRLNNENIITILKDITVNEDQVENTRTLFITGKFSFLLNSLLS